MILVLLVPVFEIPLLPGSAVSSLSTVPNGMMRTVEAPVTSSSWNPLVNCTPIIVKISDITNNQTGSSSLSSSRFSPGITSPVGDAKRWLTPGPTPPGWFSPGPACTVTNSKGTTSLFVQINGIERASISTEDSASSYEANNGGASHPLTYDSTFNVFDPAIVSSYSSSCTSASDPTCYARIHLEIDHDWKAAGYCGSGTVCDENALASQTGSSSTKIDFQGFVYWDSGNVGSSGHQFSGWELHPLTAWKLSSSPPPGLGVSFTWSPSTPVAGQAVTFTASVSGGTAPFTYAWTFGDGSALSTTASTASHTYAAMGSYSVTLKVTDAKSTSGQSSAAVPKTPSTQPALPVPPPATVSVGLGSSGASTIQLNSLNKFSGSISLAATISSTGLTASLAPKTVTLSSGGTGTATLSVTGDAVGSFTVTVTGTSGTISHSASMTVTVAAPLVASDGGLGPNSFGGGGGQGLIKDITGGMTAVYIDTAGSIVLSSTPSDPAVAGWAELTKSPTQTTAYNFPTIALTSPSLLEIFAIGGSGAGMLTQLPVTITRDSQSNIVGFTFGTPTIIDSTGFAGYPSAVLTHNGDILLAWSWTSTTSSEVRSLRWDTATGWTNFAGTSSIPDTVIADSSNLPAILPSIIERPDNYNVYIIANRLQGPPSTIAYNKATWTGSAWSWGVANLTYESNSSDGGDDPVTLAWDPVKSLVVGSYGITGTTSYGVFTLNSLDQKIHLDTPSYSVSERGWGRVAVHILTGDYYLFFMNVNGDDGSGPLLYIRHPASGSWSSTPTTFDSNTDNQGLTVRPTSTGETLDLLYVEGIAAPTLIKSARLSPPGPPNFSISANPTILTFQSGSSATSTITMTSRFNFNGTISLTTSVTPSGLTATPSPTSVTVTSGTIATSTLTANSANAGTYTITITGTAGSLTHSATVIVRVFIPPDFTITSNPSTVIFSTGSSGQSNVTLASISGFKGNLTLSNSVNPSNGLTSSCAPSKLLVPSGGSSISTCSFNSSISGIYAVTVSATNGTLTHSTSITVKVTDYIVTANPATVGIVAGSTGTSTITLGSLNGFSGTISLNVSTTTGLAASINPTSVLVASGGTSTATLTVGSSSMGSYVVTITASSGSLTHSIQVTVKVGDFAISSNISNLIINAGHSGSANISLTSLGGFQGTVSLTASVTPSGLSASTNPTSVTLVSGGSGYSILTVTSSTAGNYTVTVTGTSGSATRTVQLTITVVDFSIAPNPASLGFSSGSNGNSTLTFTSLGGYSGTITITTTVTPSTGLSASCGSSVALASGSSSNSTCLFGSSTPGTYTVTVKGTSGSLSHIVSIVVGVLDFSITANPSNLNLSLGTNGSSTITITSLGGFSGTIILTTTTSSVNLSGSTNPYSLILTSGGSFTSTLTGSNSTAGNYNRTVTATSGSLSYSIILNVKATAKPQYALVTSFDGQVYKLQNGTLTLIGQPVTSAMRQIAWKPDGSYALIAGDSGVLMKWDGSQLTQIVTGISSGTDLNTVVWSPDGSYALVGGSGGAVFKYDGVSTTSIADPSSGQIQGIAWNPSGTIALLVGNTGTFLSYQNGVITVLASGTTNNLYSVAWNPNGQYALIGGSSGSILKYNGTSTVAFNTAGLYTSSATIRFIAWNPTGNLAILVGSASGVVLTYDGSTLSSLTSLTSNGLYSVSWSGDTATIVGNSGTMLSYSAGVLKMVPTGLSSSFMGIAWKPA